MLDDRGDQRDTENGQRSLPPDDPIRRVQRAPPSTNAVVSAMPLACAIGRPWSSGHQPFAHVQVRFNSGLHQASVWHRDTVHNWYRVPQSAPSSRVNRSERQPIREGRSQVDRWLPRWLHGPGSTARALVFTAALMLAVSSLGFLLWALLTRDAGRLAWLTSMAAVLAVVLPSWGMSAGMLSWVRRSRTAAQTSHTRRQRSR